MLSFSLEKKSLTVLLSQKLRDNPFLQKEQHTQTERETERVRTFYFLCSNCEFATLATANIFIHTPRHQRAGLFKFLLQQT